jgi:hypothetical protein
MPSKTERVVRAMFEASVTVQIGNGAQTLFWHDRWLNGSSISALHRTWSKRVRNSRLVVDALLNNQWIHDITGSLSTAALGQYVRLWVQMQRVQLLHDTQDKFVWKWSPSQQYSSSAYRTFFYDQCGIPGAKVLCKTKAPQILSSSSGSLYLVAHGHQIDYSVTNCKAVAIVTFVPKLWNPSVICYSSREL